MDTTVEISVFIFSVIISMKTNLLLIALMAAGFVACGPANPAPAPAARGIHAATPSNAAELAGDDEAGQALGALCTEGDHSACNRLAASLVADGRMSDAKALYESTCEAGWATACEELGNALLAGEGLPADADAGAALLERACALGQPSSCAALAQAVLDGKIAGEESDALAQLNVACTKGYEPACESLMPLNERR